MPTGDFRCKHGQYIQNCGLCRENENIEGSFMKTSDIISKKFEKMIDYDKLSTQEFVIRDTIMKYTDLQMTPINVIKLVTELIYEIRHGNCSWAFKNKE